VKPNYAVQYVRKYRFAKKHQHNTKRTTQLHSRQLDNITCV